MDSHNSMDSNKKNVRTKLSDLLKPTEGVNKHLYSIVVYGGHDSRALRPAADLDSNFDLAYQRAVTVGDYIKDNFRGQNIAIQLAVAGSRVETACQQVKKEDQAADSKATREDRRRSPVIQLTRWTILP